MKTFEQFFTEDIFPLGKSLYTHELSKKNKFQLGDITQIGNITEQGYKGRSHVISRAYYGQIGTIKGRKVYNKDAIMGPVIIYYAVQMKDGTVIPVDSTFLRGPFKDLEAAQKYLSNPMKHVAPEDYKQKSGKPFSLQTNKEIEQDIATVFTKDPYNFTLLEKPIQKSQFTNSVESILAVRKLNTTKKLYTNDIITINKTPYLNIRRTNNLPSGNLPKGLGYTVTLPKVRPNYDVQDKIMKRFNLEDNSFVNLYCYIEHQDLSTLNIQIDTLNIVRFKNAVEEAIVAWNAYEKAVATNNMDDIINFFAVNDGLTPNQVKHFLLKYGVLKQIDVDENELLSSI